MKTNTEYGRVYREKNRGIYNAYHRQYRRITPVLIEKMLDDPEEFLFEHDPRKREKLLLATPPWADREAIRDVYREYIRTSQSYPIPLFVIHGYPISQRSKQCGLHIASNLFIVSESSRAIWRTNPRIWMETRT